MASKTIIPNSNKNRNMAGNKFRWTGYFDSGIDKELIDFMEKHLLGSSSRTLEIIVRIGLKHKKDYKPL